MAIYRTRTYIAGEIGTMTKTQQISCTNGMIAIIGAFHLLTRMT